MLGRGVFASDRGKIRECVWTLRICFSWWAASESSPLRPASGSSPCDLRRSFNKGLPRVRCSSQTFSPPLQRRENSASGYRRWSFLEYPSSSTEDFVRFFSNSTKELCSSSALCDNSYTISERAFLSVCNSLSFFQVSSSEVFAFRSSRDAFRVVSLYSRWSRVNASQLTWWWLMRLRRSWTKKKNKLQQLAPVWWK